MRKVNDKKPRGFANEIDKGLGDVFGALRDAVSEVAAQLEDDIAGHLERSDDTTDQKDFIKTHTGINVRVGGFEKASQTASELPEPRPINPNREQADPMGGDKAKAKTHPLLYDLLEDDDAWILTSDMPGVADDDLTLDQSHDSLIISASGLRRYSARVTLACEFDVASVQKTLRNGILTLRIPKGPVT